MTTRTKTPTTHINDDLVGFFNALPQSQIQLDLQYLIQQYLQQTGLTLNTATFTVDISKSSTSLHKVHRGTIKYHHKATHNLLYSKTIHLKHIQLIVQTSFDTGIVTV